MKKLISIILSATIALCPVFSSHAVCAHSYIETDVSSTCSDRAHTLKTCTLCGEKEKVYPSLYEAPDGCYFILEGEKNEDILNVTVSLHNNPGFWANRLTLNYNANALEVISTTKGDVWPASASVTVNAESETPYVRFYGDYNNLENNTKNGLIFSVSFKINGSIADWGLSLSARSRDNINVDGKTVPFEIIDTSSLGYSDHSFDEGVVTIPPTNTEAGEIKYTCGICGYSKAEIIAITGDINGDGRLDSYDMLLIKSHLASIKLDASFVAKMDVNSDSKINAKDLLFLRKRFAGLI